MPQRAFRLAILTTLAVVVSGCSHLPTPEHRAVTLDSIGQMLDERHAPAPAVACHAGDINQQLAVQTQHLDELSKQVQKLSAANPTFANASCPPAKASTQYDDRIIVGSTEWVYLTPPGKHFLARVDSGAATSSVSATNITPFERNGKKWVSFTIRHDDDASGFEVEAPLVRTASIRQASTDESVKRSVVSLTVNLGGLQQEAEFTLTDRSQMTFPILLGREFLQDVVLIDVGRQTVQPKFVPDDTNKSQSGGAVVKPASEKAPAAKKTDAKAPATDVKETKAEPKTEQVKDASKADPKAPIEPAAQVKDKAKESPAKAAPKAEPAARSDAETPKKVEQQQSPSAEEPKAVAPAATNS